MISVRCPICQQLMTGERKDLPYLPFCSERCKTIDLGRWLDERYGLPAEDDYSDGDNDERELP